jgi:uncharacterized protein YneF (UPF0154 family)
MLQICLGIYIVIALFTFLVFLGTFLDRQNVDDELRKSV